MKSRYEEREVEVKKKKKKGSWKNLLEYIFNETEIDNFVM